MELPNQHPMTHKLNLIIGKNIRNYRKRHGWTQKYLGALLGITAQQIQKYENATNAISAEKLVTVGRDVPMLP